MGKNPQTLIPRRGEIYLVNFDPTVGAEIQKTRPALVIQNDIGNRHGRVTIVAAITSQLAYADHPVNVLVKSAGTGLDHDSLVLLGQIRSIDKARLGKRLGKLSAKEMKLVDRALMISVGLAEVVE